MENVPAGGSYLMRFEDAATEAVERSGGKGANLARLTRWGFPVPEGFVVGAPAYRAFVQSVEALVREASAAPSDAAAPAETDATLHAASDALREALGRMPLPDGLESELRDQLSRFPDGTAFSVRSSSTLEDLAGAAFAGQHDTFLNCVGVDEILRRIRDCYRSLWHDRAIAYRRQGGFSHDQAAMAVVVQRMVECETAGVAFSVNPVSGDLGEIIVDANWGLGESVVGGDVEVDHFALDKATGAVRSREIARKEHRVVSSATGGIREEALEGEAASLACLDDAALRDLAALLRDVEARYGFPQDIEWGFAEGSLHLLQSRPITAIAPRWTRDESAERFPNVITPLTWDFVEEGFHLSLAHSFVLLGFPAFDGKWFALHDHYVYGNQNAVELYARSNPFQGGSLDDLRTLIPVLADRYRWVQELPGEWMRDLDHYLMGIGALLAEPLEGKDEAQLWDHVQRVRRLGAEYFLPNIAISITQGSLCRLALGLLELALGPEDGRRLYDGALAFCATKTGAVNAELVEMAGMLRDDASLTTKLEAMGARAFSDAGEIELHPAFQARFERFLRDHGHRELDFDSYQPTWLEAPWTVLDNLLLIRDASEDAATPLDAERAARKRRQEAELELMARLPEDLRYFFAELLRLAREYTSLDDLEHYQTTRLTLPTRRGLRALGSRLVEKGVLDSPMDVFFCRAAELESAIVRDDDGVWDEVSRAAKIAKAEYLEASRRSPDWVLGDASEPDEDEAVLVGLAGSAGSAEGEVYHVRSPEDFAGFPTGAVLVARTTNPAWTPLFYRAAAVITQSGGPLSHGAVTAREMGIPAVMRVRGCMSVLQDGERVHVDGAQGRVKRLASGQG